MGRKPTDEELDDPDFRALLAALAKVSKPVGRKLPAPVASPDPPRAGKPEPASSSDTEP